MTQFYRKIMLAELVIGRRTSLRAVSVEPNDIRSSRVADVWSDVREDFSANAFTESKPAGLYDLGIGPEAGSTPESGYGDSMVLGQSAEQRPDGW